MYIRLEQRLKQLLDVGIGPLLKEGLIGIEKESLRASGEGVIAQTPHPQVLGAALTHPYITTDYSEALLEFVTPPFTEVRDVLKFLCDIQTFVYARLGDELLWATSMPCVVGGEDSIPIARYGASNAGLMKHIYRRGLGFRYGRIMQVIAGVHFNYSLPEALWQVLQAQEGDTGTLQDFRSRGYLSMIRNLQRLGWLIPYLFGASPAICKSFLAGKPNSLESFDSGTLYAPYATSLRVSDIGYQNKTEQHAGLNILYNTLPDYLASLTWAITTPHPPYEQIGVMVNGEYRQLNANILQIENEHYATVRPKPLGERLEMPLHALVRRGIRYVELRSLDINPFDPLGIHEDQLRLCEAFMLFCLLLDSPPIDTEEHKIINANLDDTAFKGRDPALRLHRNGRMISLRHWAHEVLDTLQGICEVLDTAYGTMAYHRALARQREAIIDPEQTPSARILAEMRATKQGFFEFAMQRSLEHQAFFKRHALDVQTHNTLLALTQASLEQGRALEATNEQPFADFLRDYFAQLTDGSVPTLPSVPSGKLA